MHERSTTLKAFGAKPGSLPGMSQAMPQYGLPGVFADEGDQSAL